uniref:Conodipine n=1 Tax=Conus magus TaxID=6492 RepID=A0A5P8I0T7_CONMA|nr:conodipine [Conus magus]
MKILESALWILTALAVPRIAVQNSGTAELCKMNSDGCSVPFSWIRCKEHFRTACDKHDNCYVCGAHFNLTRKDCDDALHRDMTALCAQGTDDKGYCPEKQKRREASSMSITTPLRQLRLLEKRMLLNSLSARDLRQPQKPFLTCAQWVSIYFNVIRAFGQKFFKTTANATYCPQFKACVPEVSSTA